MDVEIEKSKECYNFPGIRDILRKYKSNSGKPQHEHHHRRRSKNHISSNNNKVKPRDNFKTNPYAFQDQIFKATHDKKQDVYHLHDFEMVSKNANEVEEISKMSHKQSHNYHNQHNNCFKTLFIFTVSKKKKVPSRVSSFEPQKTQTMEQLESHLPKAKSLEPIPSLGRSRSINEHGRKTPKTSRGPSMNRTTSMGSNTSSFNRRNGSFNRSTSISRSTSDMANKMRKMSLTKSGPINIMFSNSSGMLKPPTTEKELECSLEELYHGCVKHINVSRDVYTITGKIIQEEEILTVNIKPGWKTGTKITFQGTVNDDHPGEFPGDVIFIITEKHHPLFQRIDDDLELEIEIPLVDALTGCNLTIPLLGKDKMSMTIHDIVYPGFEKIIVGQGMPNQKNPNHKGDLKVKFLINYPNNLTDEQRSQISKILSH
ncbi:hypothetical protein BVRB_1g007490 [Beta vulgaris subsp. vulgaris]|nr:hypothetical protein BVRB_1g007490 [Beta vulgaris subsp. vulgaris]